jgi:hypothetical protein
MGKDITASLGDREWQNNTNMVLGRIFQHPKGIESGKLASIRCWNDIRASLGGKE